MNAWHIVALSLVLSAGCWSSHGRGTPPPGTDAGTDPVDAGMCSTGPGFIESLSCPESGPVGSRAAVGVMHHPGGCCSAGDSRLTVSRTGDAHRISSSWTVCDCCDECDCFGPTRNEDVQVGPLVLGPNRVIADSSECVIEGVAPSMCEPVASGVFAPSVLFVDQPFRATLIHEASADCGCTPAVRREGIGATMELCDCAGCDDVFTSYWAGYEHGVLPEDRYVAEFGPGVQHAVRVIDPSILRPGSGCRTIEPADVQVFVPPGNGTGPRYTWAVITVDQRLCCSPLGPEIAARSVVYEGPPRPGTQPLRVETYTCTLEDCLCMNPIEQTGQTAHNLGELAPGNYELEVGGIVRAFNVP